MIVVLSGGTGTPKLLQGLVEVMPSEDICVVVNTAEDCWLPHGYFSPDVDTVLYTLAGIIDDEVWHGIKGDTFTTHRSLNALGCKEVLRIGDQDRATHIYRGAMMRSGMRLSEAVDVLRRSLGVESMVYPMSDDPVKTVIHTPEGGMGLHEFLVERKAMPRVSGITIEGADSARPCPGLLDAVASADGIIIGPSNPVSSILPIISIPALREALRSRGNRLAVSPIIGTRPVSGPADKFMRALGRQSTSKGVAELYSGLIDYFVVDVRDNDLDIEGARVIRADTVMSSLDKKRGLAEFVLGILNIS
jgi:LPPG:FO 2-phospho-L-lactate transferase